MIMRTIAIALLALSAAFAATSAEARVDNGPVLSLYGADQGPVAKSGMSRNFKAKANRYAKGKVKSKHYAKSATGKRSARSGRRAKGQIFAQASGTSRTCLTSDARALLNRIEANFGPVSIISTCRPGAVIATSGKPSKHGSGQAIDFDAGGRKGAIVQWLIANHHSGGTMTYRDMSHIHVDVGYRFVKLGANSGRG